MNVAELPTPALLTHADALFHNLATMAAALGTARITVAVDSPETIDAVATAGLREVVIDVNIGLIDLRGW